MEFAVQDDLWYTEVVAETEAAQSLASLVGRIYGVSPFPRAARDLLALVRSGDYDGREAARIIELDAGLTTRVLRLVGSAAFSLRVACTSVEHAVTLLGARTLSEVAVAAAVLEMFPAAGTAAARVHEHLAVVAALARETARQAGFPTEDLYLCGLLHDLGKLLFIQASEETEVDDDYPVLLEVYGTHSDVLHEMERERYAFDHAVLGGHILRVWEFPEPVPTVVAWHHQPDRVRDRHDDVATAVHAIRLADRLSHELAGAGSGDDQALRDALAEDPSARALGIGAAKLAAMWKELLVAYAQSRQLFQAAR